MVNDGVTKKGDRLGKNSMFNVLILRYPLDIQVEVSITCIQD